MRYPREVKHINFILLLFGLAAFYILQQPYLLIAVIAIIVITAPLFRSPLRRIPSVPLGVVSPVDGVVSSITTVADPYLPREAIKLTLVHSMWQPHVLRAACEGFIKELWTPGQKINGAGKICGAYVIWLQTDEGDDVVFSLLPQVSWPKITCNGHSGERIGQGQVFGFAGFKTLVEVYLPANVRLDVDVNGKVEAGADILATLVHR